MGTDSNYYKEIINKLENLTKREYALFAALGIQISLLIGISVFTLFSLLEAAARFSSTARTILFFTFLILFIASFLYLFIVPLFKYFNFFRKTNYYQTAGKVGKYFPSIKDDLLNAMQLISIDKTKSLYSFRLIDAAFRQVYDKTKTVRFETIVNFKKAKQMLLYTAGISLIIFLMFLFVPSLQAASNRLINFDKEFVTPHKYSFEVTPGNTEITKGDDININVTVIGEKPDEVFLAVKDFDQTDFELHLLITDSLGNYNLKRSSVRNSFKYFAVSEDIKSEEFKIDVIDRPIIKTINITVNSPGYSSIPPVHLKDNGNVTALLGSSIDLNLTSTKKLEKAEIIFSDTSKVELSVEEYEAKGKFKIKKDLNYKIYLTDENGNINQSPINYFVKTLPDAYPAVEIIEPNENVSLANDNRLPLVLKAADDYGFTKLLLHFKLTASKYEPPHKDFSSVEIPFDKNLWKSLPVQSAKEMNINYIWNLSPMNLAAEDVVTYYLEIYDNDYVSGPKSAKTSEFTIRVPSLDEILAKADNTHAQAEEDLKETLKEADELKKDLEKINNDLKQDKKELTWEEKEKIEKALDKYEELQNKIDDVSEQLKDMQQELQQNNLLSKETMEKYMELQKLFDELTGDEMKKAMEQMRDMLEKLNRNMTQDAMQNLQIDEERFRQSIERTLNLLKRVQIEQKIDELIKRDENISEKQDEIQQQTEQSNLQNKNENEQLSEKQTEIGKETENFEKELEKLSEMMEELKNMPKEELEKLREEFEKQQNKELSQEASQNIQNQQKQEALKRQQQISQNMQSMKQQLEQMQQQMSMQNQMQAFTDMMRIMDNIITLSKQQEELKDKSESLDPHSSAFKENAEKQNNLQRNLDKIMQQMVQVSQNTFAITPEMAKSLGDAKREMSKSMQAMQNRNRNMTSGSQGEAMKSLNEAASLMKGAMENMMSGGGQGGMVSFMQQLKQMSQQQTGLNNMTQMLQQAMQGQLTPQQQAELQRLSQEQQLIQKSLEQLNKEAKESGQSKSIPSNLERIAEEMQEVIKNMQTEKLDDNLIQKQERILSRMLDAQRSINQRDFEKQRESLTGKNILRESPAELNLSSEKGKDKIKDELNRAIREGYTKDYENLIRKYYEALQKENINN